MTYKYKYNIAVNLIQNGYLIHCTDAIFNQFDSSFIKGGSRAKEGYGFYFSDMPYKSIDYGENFKVIKKSDFNFLDSNTPINIKMFENQFEIKLYQLEDELSNVRNNREYNIITQEISNIKNIYKKIGGSELFENIERAIKEYGAKTIGTLEYYIPNPDKMIPKLTQLYVYWGYDGYVTDGIYTVFNFKKLNDMVEDIDINKYNLDESLDLSSFNVQDKLNPDFWKDNLLDSRVRLKLLDIADDFTDFLNVDWVKPEDITMTGSLANYNWSEEYSDIDLHIIIDFKKVDKRTDFVREYFQSKKELWNQKHKDIKIYGYPVELYVQDKNEPHTSSGIYSLEKNDWVVKPERKKPTKSNLKKAEKNAEKWMDKIDSLLDRYYPDIIESQKEEILNRLDDVFSDIKNSRRNSFSKGGDEMNKNNLTFKMLRRNGYLDKISKKKNEIYDDLMSINESNNYSHKLYHQTKNDFNIIKSIIKNGLTPQDKNDEGCGIWFSQKPFYDIQTTTFSIPNNEETLRKYNFNPTFDGDIKIARKRIPFEELTVENIPFAIINDNSYLFSSSKNFLISMANKNGYNNIAEYLSNNKNFESIVIYKDLFDNFVENGTSYVFEKYPNVKIINLFN